MTNCSRAGGADHDRQEGERAAEREGSLGLVEDIQALAAEAVGGQRKKRLAVGLLVQRDAAVQRQVRRERRAPVDEARDVEEALRAQVVAVARLGRRQDRLQCATHHRVRDRRPFPGALELAALVGEPHRFGDRLDERRLAAAVVAGQQRDRRVQTQVLDRGHGRHGEWKPAPPLRLDTT